jgi:hypothetical protein
MACGRKRSRVAGGHVYEVRYETPLAVKKAVKKVATNRKRVDRALRKKK